VQREGKIRFISVLCFGYHPRTVFLKTRQWVVAYSFADDDEAFWSAAIQAELVETTRLPEKPHIIFSPCSLLREVVQSVEEELVRLRRLERLNLAPAPSLVEDNDRAHSNSPTGGVMELTCCDVGCGSGRVSNPLPLL
jgi:hypothetical protein